VEKICSNCHTKRKIIDFCRPRSKNPQHEHATCNKCSERQKNKHKGEDPICRKKAKLETNLNVPLPSVSTTLSRASSSTSFSNLNTNLEELELNSESGSFLDDQSTDIIIMEEKDNSSAQESCNNDDGDGNGLLYCMDEVEELVARQFREAEQEERPAKLHFEIELDSMLLEDISFPENLQSNSLDLAKIRTSFQQLTEILVLPLEAGSKYYWEIRKLCLNSRKKQFSGCATAYLQCTSRDDRSCQRPENKPVKRRSEIRVPIKRFPCAGKISVIMDPQQQKAIMEGEHLCAHEHPIHHRVEFPKVAKEWIQKNHKYHLKSTELYRRLIDDLLIVPEVHTKSQVYYWASVYSKETYIMKQDNQLESAKSYIEQPRIATKGFKLLYYLDNDFVRALGFMTTLCSKVGIANINEIIVDSTFKTNQERFELFAVNANCGGYGMPIAYLYLATSDGTEAARHDPKNQVNTRVQALREFFTSLRREGLLPAFVLTDKDSGEISAVSEAWSWRTNIQLCYWHLEHAIRRRLKDTKSRAGTYSKDKALEAHQQFTFINSSWIAKGCGSLCSDEVAKEIINLVKKHANMHPLIPVGKDTFWNSKQIYQDCVKEAYQFCYSRNLCKLWGYLWVNWYNKKDWKLFARSAYPSAMPLARTTMITESHWRVIKYNYKYNYNRPRLDCLTQILVEQLAPDFNLTLTQYITRRDYPSWWQAFKKDWNDAAAKEIEPGTEGRYHVDVDNWVCSCPAYQHSCYLLCKHLVAKKGGKTFLPTYAQTTRRHDYPFLTFGADNLSAIRQENNPWGEQDIIEAEKILADERSPSLDHLQGTSTALNNVMEKRQERLAQYRKQFEAAVTLYEQEMDNDKFIANFDTLAKPFVKAVDECVEARRAHKQQGTWKTKGKLAFWMR
jgi:hypothetical protein